MNSLSRSSSNDRRIDRRGMIRVGCAGLFGLSLPRLLQAEAGDAAISASSVARTSREAASGRPRSPARSCIFIVLSGGLSHIDTLDPRPEAPEEIRGPYRPIATSVPGITLTEPLPRLAEQAHRFCVVRSFSHNEVPHVTAAHMMLTGQTNGSTQNNSPFIGALVSKFRPSAANMPSYVWLHNMKTGTNKVPRYASGLNAIGVQNAALHVGYELDNPSSPDFRARVFDPAGGTRDNLVERTSLLRSLQADDRLARFDGPASLQRFQERAFDLVTGPDARRAFDLNEEPDAVRDAYGRNPLGQYMLMSRRLIEAGVRLVTVTGWPGLAPGETQPTITQVWDMHGDRYKPGDTMFGNGPFGMKWSLPRLDQGLAALLDDLAHRGLLDETLVVLATEFGRTPKFEVDNRGRGHWPSVYSGLFAGGGIRGGMVYGESDKQGAFVAAGRPIGFDDFGAIIFDRMGIAPETRYGPDGFSLRVSAGRPLNEIVV